MNPPMYQASVPVFIRALENLRHVLEVAEKHASERGLDAGALLQARLIFDMFPLIKQVQIATDLAKNGAARLAADVAATFADDETDFAALYARIDRTVEYLRTLQPAQFEGSETRAIHMKTRRNEFNFDGRGYLFDFAIPSLLFHCTSAYNIARANGVAIGKLDYLGAL